MFMTSVFSTRDLSRGQMASYEAGFKVFVLQLARNIYIYTSYLSNFHHGDSKHGRIDRII